MQKTAQSKFIETEAEEDEEEGRQAGLGDFGFVIQKGPEDEEEVSDSSSLRGSDSLVLAHSGSLGCFETPGD